MQTGQNHDFSSTVATCILAVVCFAAFCLQGRAAVSNYLTFGAFEAAVGPQPLIRFTEIPLGTAPTDEYASLGVQFLFDANNETESDPGAYLTDNVGLAGGKEGRLTFIRFVFATPVHSLGVDFPGALHIDLFSGTTLVGGSTNFGGSGVGHFGGVVSDVAFDRVVLTDWMAGDIYIDNLHVPEPVPRLTIHSFGSSAVQLSWTTNAPGYELEYAETLPATTWNSITNSRSIVGGDFVVTSTIVSNQRYFRLRRP